MEAALMTARSMPDAMLTCAPMSLPGGNAIGSGTILSSSAFSSSVSSGSLAFLLARGFLVVLPALPPPPLPPGPPQLLRVAHCSLRLLWRLAAASSVLLLPAQRNCLARPQPRQLLGSRLLLCTLSPPRLCMLTACCALILDGDAEVLYNDVLSQHHLLFDKHSSLCRTPVPAPCRCFCCCCCSAHRLDLCP